MSSVKNQLTIVSVSMAFIFFLSASFLSFAEVELILGEKKSYASETTDKVILPYGIQPSGYQPISGAVALLPEQANTLQSKYNRKKIDLVDLLLKAEKENEPNFDNIFVKNYTQPQVTNYLSQLKQKNNRRVSLAKERLELYEPLFKQIFKEEGIPMELIAMGFVESTYNKKAVSRAGARGMWQFIPSTGKVFGLKQHSDFEDPVLSTRAAAQYLKRLNKRFNNWLLVIAAYNAGETRVQHAINKTNGSKNFWEISRHLPRETRNYVPHVVAATAILFKDLE